MDKGERIMPVPHGVISTSEGPVDPNVAALDAVIAEAIEEIATEEYVPELVEEELPEAEENDLQ
jgi:hypothetical protein